MTGEVNTPSVTNPLWIIALLLGICELTLGAATSLTSGWIQGLFAVFMVGYTTAVTTGFFYMLVSKAQVFYSPREYRGGATVEEYSRAVARARVVVNTTEAVMASVERSLERTALPTASAHDIVQEARLEIDRSSIFVDLSTFDQNLGSISVPTADNFTVADLLDSVYFSLPLKVPAYSYGSNWLLHRPRDGKTFESLGTQWARDSGYGDRDMRLLAEVGFEAGDHLEAVSGPEIRATRRFRGVSASEPGPVQ
ncbi:hypothetical protein [Nocardia barduliensis]|uniref:hypothetical protein n=1 Tax=Nocardia barduliensis TaxID=2736643 RepID=UPI00157391D7|nr:hypothetical protein [Nocardia barduliensis]